MKFIEKIIRNSLKTTGNTAIILNNLITRANQVLSQSWFNYKEDFLQVRKAINVEVNLMFYVFSDNSLKKIKYNSLSSKLISELNNILRYEGINDWKISPTGEIIRGRNLIYFYLIREKPDLIDVGESSLRQALRVIAGFFTLKGFYLTDIIVREKGNVIFQSWNKNPSPDDVFVLDAISYSERERVIDQYVEGIIPEIQSEVIEKSKPFLEKIEDKLKKILFLAILILGIYLFLVNYAKIKLTKEVIKKID